MATLLEDAGAISVRRVILNPANDTFTIVLTNTVTGAKVVGWIMVN